MRKPQGYAVLSDPGSDRAIGECDTFTCGHCQRIVHVPARASPESLGGLCKRCMQLICPKCTGTGICDPFEEKLKRVEAQSAARRSYGI